MTINVICIIDFLYMYFLNRAYHAAKAFEECSKSFKAVFARPREPKVPSGGQYDPPMERFTYFLYITLPDKNCYNLLFT